ncbi:MAG: radical SAM protein [Paraclostridium sp.]
MKTSKYNVEIIGEENIALYNLLTRNMILIDKDQYDDINSGQVTDSDSKKLAELGFILNDDINEVKLMKYRINKGKYNTNDMALFLSLTSDCNLRCTYCYEDSCRSTDTHNIGTFLDGEEWLKVFSFIKNKSSNLSSLNIVLFGGEPLLDRQRALKIINDLSSLKSEKLNVNISIITNGINLTTDFCNKIKDNVGLIQVTIDGQKHTHDKMRVFSDGSGSFDIIYENFKNALKILKGKMSLRINVSKDTIKDIYSFIETLKNDGVNEDIFISVNAIFDTQSTFENIEYKQNVDIELLSNINEVYKYLANNNFKFEKTFIEGPCMLKHCNSYAIDENCNVYECPGVLYDKVSGKINNDFTIDFKNSRFFENIIEEKDCINTCKYAPICYGGCSWQKKCSKITLDSILKPRLESYLISKYNFKSKVEIYENAN